ncbi:MAG: hypothetical protein ACLFTT_05205 [Candidatus Hydrogenedentota bacterium]
MAPAGCGAGPEGMNGLFAAAAEVCAFMAPRGWEFCIIGGLAVAQWGEPRTTLDADMTLLTGWGEEEPYVRALLEAFEPRMPGAREFAISRRVLLIRASNGKDVDIALGALPFEEEMVQRAVNIGFGPGVVLPCCMPEDLFVMKAFADRPRDWTDAEGIAVRQKGTLDKAYILRHLAALSALKDSPDILARARRLLEEHP